MTAISVRQHRRYESTLCLVLLLTFISAFVSAQTESGTGSSREQIGFSKNGSNLFLRASTFDTASGVNVFTVADLNGDGILDIAAVGTVVDVLKSRTTVSVLLGNGDGTFQPHLDFPSGIGGETGITAGDFNGDGFVDLAVVGRVYDSSNRVELLLGHGDGTFDNPTGYTVPATTTSISSADLDADGKLDLVLSEACASDCNEGQVTVILGFGRSGAVTKSFLTGSLSCEDVRVADLNGDGHPDLVTANISNTDSSTSVLIGVGDGTFKSAVVYYATFGLSSSSVAVGDVNADGKLDLALVSPFSSAAPSDYGIVSIFLGNGDGTFQAGIDSVCAPSYWVAIADVDGDGRADLLTSSYAGLGVSLGRGDGTFQFRRLYADAVGPLIAIDANNDGKADVVSIPSYQEPSISVLLGSGDGTFSASRDYLAGYQSNSFAPGDFDGDGFVDLLTGSEYGGSSFTGELVLLRGDGTGKFLPPHDLPSPVVNPTGLVSGDFNHDGKADIALISNWSNNIVVQLGNGDTTFQQPTTYSIGKPGDTATILRSFDMNRDGNPDLIVTTYNFENNGPPMLGVFLGNSDGTFQPAIVQTLRGISAPSLAIADLDHDHNQDIVIADYFSVDVYLGNGDGSFRVGPSIDPFARNLSAVALADFNNDGKPDLAVTFATTSYGVAVLLGRGDGTFGSANMMMSTAISSLASVDFDGDGNPDLVGINSSNSEIPIFLGNGDGTFQGQVTYYGAHGGKQLMTKDINRDGLYDILDVGFDGVSVLLNQSGRHGAAPAKRRRH